MSAGRHSQVALAALAWIKTFQPARSRDRRIAAQHRRDGVARIVRDVLALTVR